MAWKGCATLRPMGFLRVGTYWTKGNSRRGEKGEALNRSDSHWKGPTSAHVRRRKRVVLRHSSSRCAGFSPRVTANPTLAGWAPRWGRVSNFWSVSRSCLTGYAVWKVDDGDGGGCTDRSWRSRAVQLPSCRENWLQIIRASFIGRVSLLIKSVDRLRELEGFGINRVFIYIYIFRFFSFEEARA